MYKLFYYPRNASWAPHLVLKELGVDHELILVDRKTNAHKSEQYMMLNPTGRIPTLIDGDLVIFESAANGEKNFNMAIELGMESTYVIKKNNKGEYVLRFMSSVPLAQAPPSTPAQTVIVYNVNPVATPVATQTSQTISTTTTTTSFH